MNPLEKLEILKNLSTKLAESAGETYRRKKWESILGQVGLMLVEPQRGYCEESPKNLITFAETGGESVHFGFLTKDNSVCENTPVAIVVPEMMHVEVLAKNLDDFLSIGCINGWFNLEFLAFEQQRTACIEVYKKYIKNDEWSWPQKENILAAIKNELSVTWLPLNLPVV